MRLSIEEWKGRAFAQSPKAPRRRIMVVAICGLRRCSVIGFTALG
ncbi:hypothetical protein [Pseudomonas argentinensis]|nr:hypothetical protein [Pseudomonas argentinensis]